jgi:hypothetical protein
MRIVLLSWLAFILSACASYAPPQPVMRMPFPQAEYEALPKTGTAVVTGQAFLKTRGGDVKTAAGNAVVLNPVTSYSTEWFEKNYLGHQSLTAEDIRLDRYLIKTVADASGRFTFKKVAPGDYYLTTTVTWETATGYQGELEVQGGFLSRRITVVDKQELDVILTR